MIEINIFYRIQMENTISQIFCNIIFGVSTTKGTIILKRIKIRNL